MRQLLAEATTIIARKTIPSRNRISNIPLMFIVSLYDNSQTIEGQKMNDFMSCYPLIELLSILVGMVKYYLRTRQRCFYTSRLFSWGVKLVSNIQCGLFILNGPMGRFWGCYWHHITTITVISIIIERRGVQ